MCAYKLANKARPVEVMQCMEVGDTHVGCRHSNPPTLIESKDGACPKNMPFSSSSVPPRIEPCRGRMP